MNSAAPAALDTTKEGRIIVSDKDVISIVKQRTRQGHVQHKECCVRAVVGNTTNHLSPK